MKEQGFFQVLGSMPEILKNRFYKQMLLSVLSLIAVIVLILAVKKAEYIFAFLIPLYFAYLGMDTVWSFQKGKTVVREVVVIKASKGLLNRDMVCVMTKDRNSELGDEGSVRKYYLPIRKKEADLLEEKTVLRVYMTDDFSTEPVAWEILGKL